MERFMTTRRLLTILFLSAVMGLSVACSKITNRLNETKLECGADAEAGADYVQIQDPRGQKLLNTQIIVRKLDAAGGFVEVKPTEKACIALQSKDDRYIVSSRLAEIPWGAVVEHSRLPKSKLFNLSDVSQGQLAFQCPANNVTRSKIANPVRLDSLAAAFPFQMKIVQGDRVFSIDLNTDQTKDEILLPSELEDGGFEIVVSNQNLFRPDSTKLFEGTRSCSYVLDRKGPELEDSLEHNLTGDLFKVNPGETIKLSLADENSASLSYCLSTEGSTCDPDTNFVKTASEITLQAPMSGRFCILYYGEDKAGNRSDLRTRCGIAFQGTLIENIRSMADSAVIRLREDRFAALRSIFTSLARFHLLPTEEEKASLRSKILSSLLAVGFNIKERVRITPQVSPRNMFAFEDKLIEIEASRVNVRDPISFAVLKTLDFEVTSHSSAKGVLLLGGKNGFKIFRNVSRSLELLTEGQLPSHIDPIGTYSLNPRLEEFVFISKSNGAFSNYRFEENSFELVSESKMWSARRFIWAKDGLSAVAIDLNQTFGLQRNEAGGYDSNIQMDYLPYAVNGAAYIEVNNSFLLVSTTGVKSWKMGQGIQHHSIIPGMGEQYTKLSHGFFDDHFLAVTPTSAYVAYGAEILEIAWKNSSYFASVAQLPKTIDFNNLRYWAMIDGQLHIHHGSTYSMLVKRSPDNQWFIAKNFNFGFKSDRTLTASFPDLDRFVTYDGTRGLISWSGQNVFGSFVAEGSDTGFVRWVREKAMSLIATGSLKGYAKLWRKNGRLDAVFPHSESPLSFEELNWNEDRSRFVTSGSDGRSVVWKRNGQRIQELVHSAPCDETSKPTFTASFSPDGKRVLTSGMAAVNVWTAENEIYTSAANCPEPNPNLAKTGRGDLQIFRWSDSDVVLVSPSAGSRSINFFNQVGGPSPVWSRGWQSIQAYDLSKDKRWLALSSASKGIEIFELTENGFELRSSDPKFAGAVKLSWSEDSSRLAAFYNRSHVSLFEHLPGSLRFVAKRSLLNEDDIRPRYYPFWIPNGFAYFDSGRLVLTDYALKLETEIKPFAEDVLITAADYDAISNTLLVQANGEVRIVPLDFSTVQSKFCEAFDSFIRNPSAFLGVHSLGEDEVEFENELREGLEKACPKVMQF